MATSKSFAFMIVIGLVLGAIDQASSLRDIADNTVPGLTEAAYPVKWNDGENPPHEDPLSWTEAAYPVKWNGRENSPEDSPSWTEAAYPVKWNGRENSPEDSPSWTEAAYPVKWNGRENALEDPPFTTVNARTEDSKQPILPEAAYSVKWDPDNSPRVASASRVRAPGHGLHVQQGMLFLRTSLYEGATLPQGTKLAANGFPRPREFISKVNSAAAPFGYQHLDEILASFGIPRGSAMAAQVASTLRSCEATFDEPHTCATSPEAAAEFAAAALGTTHLRRAVSIVHGIEPSRYRVAENGIRSIGGTGAALVPCHPMPFPFAVFFCHRPESVEALRVELIGDAGAKGSATAVAVCHKNTSNWDNRYFEMLSATCGEEICHFMPENYMLWVSGDSQ